MAVVTLKDAETDRKVYIEGAVSAAGVMSFTTDALDAAAGAHITAAPAVANHGLPKLNVVAGGNAESNVTGMAATDVIVGGILVTVAADTGTDATGNKVTTLADIALTAGAGKVTYAGDQTGNLIIVSWIDRTA